MKFGSRRVLDQVSEGFTLVTTDLNLHLHGLHLLLHGSSHPDHGHPCDQCQNSARTKVHSGTHAQRRHGGQYQGFICYFCQPITLQQEIRFLHLSGRASSVQESAPIKGNLYIILFMYFIMLSSSHQFQFGHGRLISQKVGWKVYVTMPLMKITWALNIFIITNQYIWTLLGDNCNNCVRGDLRVIMNLFIRI